MKGSGKTLERQKEDMFDEYERFRANGNESIQDYFIRFHKLVNDMKVTQIDLPKHQLNTKFVNNLPAYWSKYVSYTKNVMNMSADNYVDIFTLLRTYEPHALKSLKKLEQSSSSDVDPLAYLAKSSTPPQSSPKPTTQAAQTHEEALMATMQQLANLLSGFQKQFPPNNNQIRASSKPKSQATVQAGQIVTETVQRSAPGNVGKQ
nr:hypothetical protein [Tanacetum cinerariifolium]